MIDKEHSGPIVVPASSAQRKFWEVHRLNPATNADNLVTILPIPATAGADVIQAAVATVVGRHEILRTRFNTERGTLVQVIDPVVDQHVIEIVLDGIPEEPAATANQIELLRHAMDDAFDLAHGPVLRVILISFDAATEKAALLVSNHTYVDGWSFNLVREELSALLDAWRFGCEVELVQPVRQFRHVHADRAEQNPIISRQREYWMRRLAGVHPRLSLPTVRARKDVGRETLKDERIELPGRDWSDVVRSAQDHAQCSVDTLYIAAVAASLARFVDDEVVIGNVYCNRRSPRDRHVVGLLFNVLPLRISLAGLGTTRDLIRRVQAVVGEGYLHGEIAIEDIAVDLGYGQAVLGGGPPLWEAAVNVLPLPRAGVPPRMSPEWNRWLCSLRGEPVMERWDGRIIELITEHHTTSSGAILRYNSEILDSGQAVETAAEVAKFLVDLPSLLDRPITWHRSAAGGS